MLDITDLKEAEKKRSNKSKLIILISILFLLFLGIYIVLFKILPYKQKLSYIYENTDSIIFYVNGIETSYDKIDNIKNYHIELNKNTNQVFLIDKYNMDLCKCDYL